MISTLTILTNPRIWVAILIDVLDALVVVPTTDLGESPGLYLAATLLGVEDESLKLLCALDGILPPPIDFFPSVTVAVIYEDYFKNNRR